MKKAVLFLNGEIDLSFCESHLYPEAPIKDFESEAKHHIYCADGAFLKLIDSPRCVQDLKAIYGDFDSIESSELKNIPAHIKVEHLHDQDHTDFAKSLMRLAENYQQIDIYGVSGQEMDHFLGNLSVAMHWTDKLSIRFIDAHSEFFIADKCFLASGVLGKMVSVIPLFEMKSIHYKGLKYTCDGDDLIFGAKIGTRNFAIKDDIEIKCTQGKFIVFISHKPYKAYVEALERS